MIGLRIQPAGKGGITVTTLESRPQQLSQANGSKQAIQGPEKPIHDIFNNGRKGIDRGAQSTVYVLPAKRRQEVRFVEDPVVVPEPHWEITNKKMKHILDQPTVLPWGSVS